MPSGLIIVCGGSRGIGAAICRRLAADGHAVAVNYTADAKAAETTVAEIKKSGGRAQAIPSALSAANSASSMALARSSSAGTAIIGSITFSVPWMAARHSARNCT